MEDLIEISHLLYRYNFKKVSGDFSYERREPDKTISIEITQDLFINITVYVESGDLILFIGKLKNYLDFPVIFRTTLLETKYLNNG